MSKKNIKSKLDNSDFTNLPLAEYYDNLPSARRMIIHAPKESFLNELATLTGRTPETVRSWCLGKTSPTKNTQKLIAKYLKSEPEILFPEI